MIDTNDCVIDGMAWHGMASGWTGVIFLRNGMKRN
jgi:hypothetical protein